MVCATDRNTHDDLDCGGRSRAIASVRTMTIRRPHFLTRTTDTNARTATASGVLAQLDQSQVDDQRSLDAAVSEGWPVSPLYPRARTPGIPSKDQAGN